MQEPTAEPTNIGRLLLVEDDQKVVTVVRDALEEGEFTVEHVTTIGDAQRRLAAQAYDAMILDLTLPDGDGRELASKLRASGSELPILMLTAQSSVDARVEGLRRGADDYLCKPFAVEELLARLSAIIRRARSGQQHILRYADVELDLLRRVVKRKELQATLSAREMDLLVYLLRHPEQVVSRTTILEEVWGGDAENDSNVLNVYINYLRNKLERGQYSRILHTVRGVGIILSEVEPDEIA